MCERKRMLKNMNVGGQRVAVVTCMVMGKMMERKSVCERTGTEKIEEVLRVTGNLRKASQCNITETLNEI